MKLFKRLRPLPLAKHPKYILERDWADDFPHGLHESDPERLEYVDQLSREGIEDLATVFNQLSENALGLLRLDAVFVGAAFAIFRTDGQASPNHAMPWPVWAAMLSWLVAMGFLAFASRRKHRPTHGNVREMFEAIRRHPETNLQESICLFRHKQRTMYEIVIARESRLFNLGITFTILGLAFLLVATFVR